MKVSECKNENESKSEENVRVEVVGSNFAVECIFRRVASVNEPPKLTMDTLSNSYRAVQLQKRRRSRSAHRTWRYLCCCRCNGRLFIARCYFE